MAGATTRRECLRVVTPVKRSAGRSRAGPDDTAIGEEIMMAERNAALRRRRRAPAPLQRLLGMLVSDPPYSYAAISAAWAPGRQHRRARDRCLERIRESSALLRPG